MSDQANHFVAKLIPPRPTFPYDMRPDEEKIMSDHAEYFKSMIGAAKVLVYGPCFDPVYGLAILQTGTKEEAERIMKDDPSVKSGLNRFEVQPMHLAFLAGIYNTDRYVNAPSDRIIRKEVVVQASLKDTWEAWTTTEGVKSFFSEYADIQLAPGGRYEVYFLMDRPYGERGSEDCRLLSFLPMTMLSFEWNAPPEFGELRDKRTIVVLQFEELGPEKVRVVLYQHGWGIGPQWDTLYDYFDKAWQFVLDSLMKRFAKPA